ncbi:MAG TPA: hypothetical protein P5277_03710 [Candidatus Paceibacterota bacterium]|nr:hypothetical protein [Candidatus Paceibacterota bacterium]
MDNILASDFAVYGIYPFLLVFTLIFAILQKTKILGEDKKQIDALVALSVALITISFSYATGVISKLMPFLAVAAVILLVFMILYGFVASTSDKGLELSSNMKKSILVLSIIGIIFALIWATGQWDLVYGSIFEGRGFSSLASNVLMISIIGGALAVVLFAGKKRSS